jgi:tRNA nucleotidyltransferase (CCA-adding enzyme)
MHMRPRPRQEPIVDAGLTPEAFAEALRRRLAPEHWPVPLDALPPDAALVGGAVRDAALGRLEEHPDLDLVVGSAAINLARDLARRQGGTCVVLDAERDMTRLVLRGWTLDLARREGPDLASDLRRRDYTVNALALPLAPGATVVDATGGLEHLHRRQLVAVSEANLLDDPLRLLRGVRLAAELGFSLDGQSRRWIGMHAPRLAQVAGERVLAELDKLAVAPEGHQGLQLAAETGLLESWGAAPSAGITVEHLNVTSAESRGLNASELAEALPLARLAWLLDGRAVAGLKGSRRLEQRCGSLRQWWQALTALPLEGLEERERLALHEQLNDDLPALLLARPPEESRPALARWRDPGDPLFHPRSPLDGRRLQQSLGLAPGPQLGQLLRHLKRERAFGRLPHGHEHPAAAAAEEAALACARLWLQGEQPAP